MGDHDQFSRSEMNATTQLGTSTPTALLQRHRFTDYCNFPVSFGSFSLGLLVILRAQTIRRDQKHKDGTLFGQLWMKPGGNQAHTCCTWRDIEKERDQKHKGDTLLGQRWMKPGGNQAHTCIEPDRCFPNAFCTLIAEGELVCVHLGVRQGRPAEQGGQEGRLPVVADLHEKKVGGVGGEISYQSNEDAAPARLLVEDMKNETMSFRIATRSEARAAQEPFRMDHAPKARSAGAKGTLIQANSLLLSRG